MSLIHRINSSTALDGVPLDAPTCSELAGMIPITATPAAVAAGVAAGAALIGAAAGGAALGDAVD